MGLLDIFKKTPTSPADNESVLETVLRKASSDPSYRSEFYKRLLSENLIVLTDKSSNEGVRMLEKDTTVNIVSLQDGQLPVFTSKSRIFDKGIIKEQVPFMAIKGEDLFNLTKGATLILNPYSDYGKQLLPGEIENMLNGTILTSRRTEITVEKETEVQIGQPAQYPAQIIDALKILFASRPAVRKAYLGWIFNPSSGEPPHYIFALDIEGDHRSIMDEAGLTAKRFLNVEDIIDFIQIDGSGGLEDYFLKKTVPFYER